MEKGKTGMGNGTRRMEEGEDEEENGAGGEGGPRT